MGRGRAKAKQTKVARELKYQSLQTDFGALAKELHGEPDTPVVDDAGAVVDDEADEEYDQWSDYSESSRD